MEWFIDCLEGYGISGFEVTAMLRLLMAAVCGGLIGLEREMKGRPAGLKTFSLVCVGSTLAMITNEFIYLNLAGGSGDSARMAAQVISGIGFLGAGTIMVTGHNQVKGLTTAAALWMTASIGIAIGSGFYFGAVMGVVVIFISSVIYRLVDKKIVAVSRMMSIYVESTDEEFMLLLVAYFNTNGIKVLNLTRKAENKWYESDTGAVIEMDLGRNYRHELILQEIRKLEGLRYVEEVRW